MAFRKVDGSRAERVEDVLESGQQRDRWEQASAGRSELDREGQPVEAATDLRDGGGVRVVQREVVADRPRPIDEEAHRRQRRELLERRAPGERRDGERLHGVLALGAEAQHGAARGEDPDVRTCDEELIELGCHARHLLEVVENQQRRALCEELDQGVERRARAFDGRPDGGGDAWQHQCRVGDGRERHELHVALVPVERRADGDRQPRLADPARAGQRDQPHIGRLEQRGQLRHVGLATDQRRRRRRK